MIPYFFYVFFRESIHLDFNQEFSLTLPWDQLIGLINYKWLKARKKLTKTDVMICKTLSRYNIKGQKYVFPLSNEIVANRTRQSISSIANSHTMLFIRLIAQDFFLINPWKLGWKLYILIYPSNNDESFKPYDSLTISKEYFYDNTIFRVLQQPSLHDESEIHTLKNIAKQLQGSIYEITKTSFHWDLSGLEPREDKSFRLIPNFVPNPVKEISPSIEFSNDTETLDWLRNLDSKNNMKLYFNKKRKIYIEEIDESTIEMRKSRIIKIINFILSYGITLKSANATAKSLDIPIHEFSRLLHYLIKTEVISLGYRFKFIGAGNEYSFLIKNGTPEMYHFIKQSLLQCPFSYFYQGEDFLAGRCQVPDTWMGAFMEFFMKLRLMNPELTIGLGQRVLGYNFFSPNIRMPENFVLNEFGMKEMIVT